MQAPYPRTAYAWYVVALLIVGYVVAFIDRGILALLIEPIKADLALNDTQMSWLMGPAFGIFYVTLGIPIGMLADRYSRRNIIIVGIVLWSLATAACGLADGFAELFAARVMVGVGEATLAPAALSIISDYFPRDRALRAVGLFNMGQSVGAGLAFLLGGQVILWVTASDGIDWPVLSALAPWQVTFVLVGLPGLLVALLLRTVQEPVRRGYLQVGSPADSTAMQPQGLRAALAFMRQHGRAFGALMAGNATITIIGYSFFWIPSMYARTWNMEPAAAGIWYGIVLATMGPMGVIVGSQWSSRRYARGESDAPFSVLVIVLGTAIPFCVAMAMAPSAAISIALLAPAMFGLAAGSATSTAAVIHVAPAQFRSKISAIHLLVISLAGLFLGPTSVALLTDKLFADPAALRWSMLIVAAVVGSLGVGLLASSRQAYRKLAVEADTWHGR